MITMRFIPLAGGVCSSGCEFLTSVFPLVTINGVFDELELTRDTEQRRTTAGERNCSSTSSCT